MTERRIPVPKRRTPFEEDCVNYKDDDHEEELLGKNTLNVYLSFLGTSQDFELKMTGIQIIKKKCAQFTGPLQIRLQIFVMKTSFLSNIYSRTLC